MIKTYGPKIDEKLIEKNAQHGKWSTQEKLELLAEMKKLKLTLEE